MRSRVWGRSDKESLNTNAIQKKKKMTKQEKEDLAWLEEYTRFEREVWLSWMKRGRKLDKIDERLKREGYVDFRPNAEIDYKPDSVNRKLRYETGILTNKGYAYFRRLKDIQNKDKMVLAAIISTIATLVSAGFAIFAWLVATGKIK